MPLYASSTVLFIRRSVLYYTVSGIITLVGGRLVHKLREEGTTTYRCDDIRRCMIQF